MVEDRRGIVRDFIAQSPHEGAGIHRCLQAFTAYIADDDVNLGGVLPVLELEPSNTVFSLFSPQLPQAEVWTIRHFSRYILASG